MRIECLHGYFKFSEVSPGQISRFMSIFDVEIERSGDHFTFSDLVDAPTHAIAGGLYLGAPVLNTYEGAPWEILRANDLVYHIKLGQVMPILSVINVIQLAQAGSTYVSGGMIQPGSIMEDGSRVKDYAAFYIPDSGVFKYSEVSGD